MSFTSTFDVAQASHATGTSSSYPNLSLAGVAAADVALAIAKVSRNKPLREDEKQQLRDVSDSLTRYGNVFQTSDPYLALVEDFRPIDTLAEIAVQSGQDNTSSSAAERFKHLSAEIIRILDDEKIPPEELEGMQVYFHQLSRTISRMLTSSGEKPGDDTFW